MKPTDALRAFRDSLYSCFDQRADALFELADAILTAGEAVPSPVHLSLQPYHRRGWASLYAALETEDVSTPRPYGEDCSPTIRSPPPKAKQRQFTPWT